LAISHGILQIGLPRNLRAARPC